MYLASRLPGLLSMPIFLDEAIHIRSAGAAMSGQPSTGASLGKWLSIHSYSLVQRVLDESLLIARIVPVVLGALTVCLLYASGRRFSQQESVVSAVSGALLYIFLPLSLFYDRLALTDQFLTLLLALMVFFSYSVAEGAGLLARTALGGVIVLSPLFKFSGLLLVPVPIVIVWIVSRRRFRDLVLSYALAAPGIVFFALYAVPVGEFDKLIGLRPINVWLQRATHNVQDVLRLFGLMVTPGVLLVLAIGITALLLRPVERSQRRRVLAGLTIMVLLSAPYVLFFEVWYPRYLLPVLVPLCLLGGEVSGAASAPRRSAPSAELTGSATSVLLRAFWLLALILAAAQSLLLLVTPRAFPYPDRIRSQFVTAWTSGYGLQDAIATIHRLSTRQPGGITIVRSPWEDMPLQGLDVYVEDLDPRIRRVNLYPWEPDAVVARLSEVLAGGRPTYLLFNSAYPYPGDREVIERIRCDFRVRELAHFIKPDLHPGLRIWRLMIRSRHASC